MQRRSFLATLLPALGWALGAPGYVHTALRAALLIGNSFVPITAIISR